MLNGLKCGESMSALVQPPNLSQEIFYPESDGLPMADNTKQFEWIVTIKEGLDVMLPHDFVAGNIFWYPVEGNPYVKQASDVLVALGRPKGDRGSYKQWEEGNVSPQVVFEVLSPGNTYNEMVEKEGFYERHGVEEYYLYDPYKNNLWGWQRINDQLEKIHSLQGWVSPRLGIRFERSPETLEIYRPDGERFLTFAELDAERLRERREKEVAQARAEQAESRAEQAESRAEQERLEKERLKQKLRELGVDPDQV